MSEVQFLRKSDERLFYTVTEVAQMLSVGVPTIYRHIREGSLVALDTRIPGSAKASYRITRASIEAFFAAAEQRPVTAEDLRAAGAK